VRVGNADRGAGRLLVRADDRSLTAHAGLAVVGDLARQLDLVGLIDGELALEQRARAVKTRRRGASAGELVVSLAECQLIGGAFFDHLEDLRADTAGAGLRAVGNVPSAPAALQVSKRFRRVHCQRVERAMARAGARLDRALGRDAGEPVTIDLDATQITVFGRFKQGAARCRTGEMSYAPHVAFWAPRGRALTGELVGGNHERLSGAACATIATRAIDLRLSLFPRSGRGLRSQGRGSSGLVGMVRGRGSFARPGGQGHRCAARGARPCRAAR
jgi:hypothetical protein